MPATDAVLYKAHVKNLRALEAGLSEIKRDLNRAIADENIALTETLKKLYLFLAGAWAECRLKKLMYETSGFNGAQRALISAERSQADRWQKSLELGFRKRYGLPHAPLSDRTLSATAWFRFAATRQIIAENLEPLIGLRNTLAHGQWARPLNSEETDISSVLIAQMNQENALTVKFKLQLITSMAELIHDLIASRSFERDFDIHYGLVTTALTNLQKRSYAKWQQSMIEKKRRGRAKRDTAIVAYSRSPE